MNGPWDRLTNKTRDRLIVFIAFIAACWMLQQLVLLGVDIYLLLK